MKKLIELLKKLLGGSSSSSGEQKGFTLIELIIVIAILGILAAAVLAAIDPIDKINAGNDTKVQTNTRSIYDATLRYYTINSTMPTQPQLTSSGELKAYPNPPSGYAPYTFATNATDAYVCGIVKSKSQRAKAPGGTPAAPVAAAVFIVSNGQSCYRSVAACPVAYTACP